MYIREYLFHPEYSKKLTAAGVHNELYLSKGAIHAFFTLPGQWYNSDRYFL